MLTIEVDEIWFVDKFWPFEGKDINKYEKSIRRHISVVVVNPKWHDNNGHKVKIETE